MDATSPADPLAAGALSGPLPGMDRPARLDRVRQGLGRGGEGGVEALLVTKPVNVRWLTGFTGSNGQVLVTDEAMVLVTDGRYREQADRQLGAAGLADLATIGITITEVGAKLAQHLGGRRGLGLEAHHVTWKQVEQYRLWLPGAELVPLEGSIEELRRIKDPGELARLVRAAAIADAALAEVAPLINHGITERELGRRLDNRMLDLGADGLSFETIVAAGPNSALPHHRPADRPIEAGDLVVIDFGASVDGYGSDMTRTFVAGGRPSAEQRRLYDAVLAAQAAGVAAVADGVPERRIDEACRELLAARGLAEQFIHGTGHAIGLEIHEDPILSARSVGILRTGFVVTVEPGVYVSGVGGVRIEDSVVVDATGCRPITHSPKTVAP